MTVMGSGRAWPLTGGFHLQHALGIREGEGVRLVLRPNGSGEKRKTLTASTSSLVSKVQAALQSIIKPLKDQIAKDE
ncbi:hypothetical protein ASE61_00415 [Bosea sp. Root670]|nr:hypothetical protein ASE61_00415 [Bosea sp. Root670]